jgi:AbiA family abortive infection protein
MHYDSFTREQIICLFQFISNGKSGIPQSDNNIISNFIGYLYLVFGDLFIDNMLKTYRDYIEVYKIIRYTDDIHISMTFKQYIDEKKQGEIAHVIASQIAEILYEKLNLKLNLKTRLFRLKTEKEKKEYLKTSGKMSPGNEYMNYDKEEDDTYLSGEDVHHPQDKLENIFKELRRIKRSKIEDYFVRNGSVQEEILQEVFNKSVEKLLNKPDNKNSIMKIFENFNFDLIKVQPLEILVIIFSNETTVNNLHKFLLHKKIITTSDADLIIKFLCQTKFSDDNLISQLKKNNYTKKIAEVFLDANLNCDIPGYHCLTCMQMKKLSKMPDVIEQIRLRVLSERSGSYSVALNHLVNEIQAVCVKLEQKDKKDYDVNKLVEFINSKHIPHETCITIRNLFDRRNNNSVSHPGSDNSISWEVTKEEYLNYYEHVGECLNFLL